MLVFKFSTVTASIYQAKLATPSSKTDPSMNNLKQFFLFCSGIDQSILKQCPSDENKYLGIGATVFFTGVLAFFSAGYALYTIFDSYVAAILFGLIWGLMIFNLDRYIVASMKSKGSVFRDFFTAFPRLIMAVLLALVISKPLELKIFEKEINAELIVMEQEVFKNQEDQLKARYQPQIEAYQQEVVTLKQEIEEKTTARDERALMALQEADGSGGSGIRNMGPIYRAKKADADQAQAELAETLARNNPLIAQKEAAITELENTISSEIGSLERESFGGMAARMDALDRLGQESQAIYWATIFITLLFMAIETAPIFVKLISPRSPYDYLLNQHEHVFAMAHKEQTTLLRNDVQNKLREETEVGIHQMKANIKTRQAEIDADLQKRLDALRNGGFSY